MTLPYERNYAIRNTRQFLYDLIDPKKIPRIPKAIRRMAGNLLKHYPTTLDMDKVKKLAPEIFADEEKT